MYRKRLLQFLASMGLEFWLPLPLLGLSFWVVSDLVTSERMSQHSLTYHELKIPQNTSPNLDRILSIRVIVDRSRGISLVKIKQAKQAYVVSDLKLTTTEIAQIEVAIASQLGLSLSEFRRLVRYQIQN